MDGDTTTMIGQSRSSSRRAFTLVEIVVTLALGILIVSTVGLVTIKFIEQRELEITSKTLVSYLRTAQTKAANGEGGLPHGVSRANGNITLFRGETYSARQSSFDTIFPYPGYVLFSGLEEVVFSRQSGLPAQSGDMIISAGGNINTVTIYATGAISRP